MGKGGGGEHNTIQQQHTKTQKTVTKHDEKQTNNNITCFPINADLSVNECYYC